jgi:uncharacterized protein (DUF58 family)
VSTLTSRFTREFPGFSLRATPVFWSFLVAVPVLGLAALNAGNNALYLLLALTLGAFVSSGVLSRQVLRNLRVTLVVNGDVFAGTPTRVRLLVRNRSRWLPASGVVCRVVGLPGSALVPGIEPGGEVTAFVTTVFPSRGRSPLPAVHVEIRLPLGFFVKIVRWPQAGELLVFPRIVRANAGRWVGLSRSQTVAVLGTGTRGGEVQHLREFHPGDDFRDVHWKQTARQQRVIVMERRERPRDSRFLVLDRQLPLPASELWRERFEDLISEVASVSLSELRRGEQVGLILGGSVMPPASGHAQIRRVLERLAVVEPVGPGEDPLPAEITGGGVYRLVAGP